MDNIERAVLDALKRVKLFNTTYGGVTGPLTTVIGSDYADEVAVFDPALAKIIEAGNVQEIDNTGLVDVSDADLNAMVKAVQKYARRGKVKAKRAGKLALVAQLKHPDTYYKGVSKDTSLQRAKDTRKALNDNLLICTNVTAGNITEIDGKIAAFDSSAGAPVAQIKTKKAAGTDVLPDQTKIALDAVENMFDLIVSFFEDTVNSGLIDEFTLASHEIVTGTHHNVVDIKLEKLEDGSPIEGHIKDNSNNKEYDSVDANVHIATHKSGKTHFTVSAPGRNTVDFEADIKRSTHNTFTVKLSAV